MDEGNALGRFELPILDRAFKADPYRVYEALRGTGKSVIPVRLPTGVEAWLVIGYETARRLLNDARLSKRPAGTAASGNEPQLHPLFRHLLMLDPPEHTRLRAIMARALSAQRIKRLRARIAGIADQLADAMAQRREVDLIESFAMPFPLRVICEALGVPAAAEPLVQSWSARLEAADLKAPEQVPRIAQEMHDYLLALAQAKRLAPDDSLLGALVAAHGRGALSESELTATAFLLLLAGHETTANLIGNGVLALLRHGTAWSALCGPPDLAAVLVEELLRLESPLEVATARFATSQIELEGVCIQPGDRVFIGLAAANRDPARFDRPHRLQADRCPMASHLAFGHGIHYCLGAALARLEGEVAFSVLARRFPDLELAAEVGDLLWKPGLIMRGLERLPVYCGRRLE